MRTVTPGEIRFRLGEGLRFLAERSGREPRIELLRTRGESPDAFAPLILAPALTEREEIRRLFSGLYPSSADRVLAAADGIIGNRLPVFSGIVDFGERVDWHLDYTSGTRAPMKFYRDIETFDARVVGDIKHIWEVNRHNYFIYLGMASWLSDDPKYYEKWKELIAAWIRDNPYNRGVNWESSLELAFRAINWIWSSWFFTDELANDPRFSEQVFNTLYLHGVHIHGHLSYYFSPNTHLTGEALGLLYLARTFPAMKPASRWISDAEDILEGELKKQIYDDGGYFEMATYYHRYTIDFYLHYLLLADRGKGRPGDAKSRIAKMVEHLALLSGHDGTIPLAGDSDGGRLLFLSGDKRDIRGACCAAAVLLEDGGLKDLCGPHFHEEALWLLGSKGLEKFKAIPAAARKGYHSINRESGVFCFRTGMSKTDSYILIDCGPHGWGGCGHAHSDLLSYQWCCCGTMALVDPGTFSYSSAGGIRDESRISQSHNTITFNDISQSIPGDVFKWRHIAHPRGAMARVLEDCGYFEGSHDAYDHIGCRHGRAILFFGGSLSVVIDYLDPGGTLPAILHNLQFSEGELVTREKNTFLFRSSASGGECYIRYLGTGDLPVEIADSACYPDYHKAVGAPRLKLEQRRLEHDSVLITLLSSERDLLDDLVYENGCLRGGDSSFRYSVDTGVQGSASWKGETFIPAVSAVLERGDETLVMMRNCSQAFDASGTLRFDAGESRDFLAAVIRNGEMHVKYSGSLSRLVVPDPVEKIYLNGSEVSFDRKDDEILIRS